MVFHSKKNENLDEAELLAEELNPELADIQGDWWTFIAVLHNSSYIHTTYHGKRTADNAQSFIANLKSRSDGSAPYFCSDCWFYKQALIDNYCTYEPVPYSGRGRRPGTKQVVDPNLKYAQVHKKRDQKGRLEEVTTRIVLGDELELLEMLADSSRCKTINTSYVESRNGKLRKDNARLIRRTLCHSKKTEYHDAQINFIVQVMNYTRTNDALKVLVNPSARLFEHKYKHQTPAMAQGLIDRKLTIKELLAIRPRPIGIP